MRLPDLILHLLSTRMHTKRITLPTVRRFDVHFPERWVLKDPH